MLREVFGNRLKERGGDAVTSALTAPALSGLFEDAAADREDMKKLEAAVRVA